MGRVQLFPYEAEQDKTICWVRTGVPWVGSELVSGHTMESKFGIRFFVFCSGADVTVGTRHLCAGECAGELNHRSGGKRHMCSFAWFSWFPPQSSAAQGWGRQQRVWTDFRVSSALLLVISADRFWDTSWSLLCRLLGGFLWRVSTLTLVEAHCTWFLKLIRMKGLQNTSTQAAGILSSNMCL